MRILCLFGTRKYDPPVTNEGEAIPELMVAWDEYTFNENPVGFQGECDKAKESWGEDLADWRLIEIEVELDSICERFRVPAVEGRIVT